jgi:hypothetical protein
MKTLKITFLLVLFVATFTACDTNDDDFYNTTYVTIPNLVQIQTQSNYVVGDYLLVTSMINRFQNEPNQTSLLDLRKSSNNADAFKFSYLLEKKINATDWLLVDASPSNRMVISGQFETGSFYDASATFNALSDQYEFQTGIKLTTTGQYRLSFGYNSSATNLVELRSNSINGAIFININSTINNLDSDGYYNFTVN